MTPARPATRPPAPRDAAAVPQCHDDVCITCSDEAVEVTILRLTR